MMQVYEFEGMVPVVDPSAFVHPTAVLIGDVMIGAGCYIGACAVLRGDFGRLVVEEADLAGVQNASDVIALLQQESSPVVDDKGTRNLADSLLAHTSTSSPARASLIQRS